MLQYLDRQGDAYLKGVFDKFAGISDHCVAAGDTENINTHHHDGVFSDSKPKLEPCIRAEGLQAALLELGVRMDRNKVEELLVLMDLDESSDLNFEEFKRAVQQPPTQLEQWAGMLPLAGLLARSLPVSGGQGAQPLRDFSRLDDIEINTAVEVFSAGLKRLLITAQATSRLMFENMDKKAFEASKDLADGVSAVSKFKTFKMSTGNVADFYEGLFSRTGM